MSHGPILPLPNPQQRADFDLGDQRYGSLSLSLGRVEAMRERTISNGSVDLSTRISGYGDTSVVLVHGYGTNLATWEKLRPCLNDSCTVVAYDRAGTVTRRVARVTPW